MFTKERGPTTSAMVRVLCIGMIGESGTVGGGSMGYRMDKENMYGSSMEQTMHRWVITYCTSTISILVVTTSVYCCTHSVY